MKVDSKRILGVILLLILMALLMGFDNKSEAKKINAVADDITIQIQVTQNSKAKYYNFLPYQSIYLCKDFFELRDGLLISGKLIGTQTIIVNNVGKIPVIAHKIVALKSKNKNCKPFDKLEIQTNSIEIAEECRENYETNAGFKLKGVGKKDDTYVLVFER